MSKKKPLEIEYEYKRFDEDGDLEYAPSCDYDGKITGKIIYNLHQYFEENPEEYIRLGYTKYILNENYPIDYKGNQLVLTEYKNIDEHTIKAIYHVIDAPEERILIDQLLNSPGGGNITIW